MTLNNTRSIRNKTSVPKSRWFPESIARCYIIHKGNYYSRIQPDKQSAIYELLLSACHPSHLLKKEGYVLPVEPDPEAVATTSLLISAPTNEQAKAPESEPELESGFLTAPERDESLPKRRAVVLDCEMVSLERENGVAVVKIVAIDFLTGEELVYSLVDPQEPVENWFEHITGLSPLYMKKAAAKGWLLAGGALARAELLKHIDKDTILVGQSLNYDLAALRMAHAKIVDTGIMTSVAVFGELRKSLPRPWGLQALCKELVGIDIRCANRSNPNLPSKESQGAGDDARAQAHDTTEDVLAAREVVLRCLRDPAKLDAWALRARKDLQIAEKRRAELRANIRYKLRRKAERKKEKLEMQAESSHGEDSVG